MCRPFDFFGEDRSVTRSSSIAERRRVLRDSSAVTFVQRDEYFRLLTSQRKAVRADDSGACLRGVLDLDTGELFLIEQEQLFKRS
jgi:hypothetical protein